MGQKFSIQVLKVNARNIEYRCQSLTNKRSNEYRTARKAAAKALSSGCDETARFELLRMERCTRLQTAYKLLTLAGRHICDNATVIDHAQFCPAELMDSCAYIIFSTDRLPEVTELHAVSEQLFLKFGDVFVAKFRINNDEPSEYISNELQRCFQEPNFSYKSTVKKLNEIALEFDISWTPKSGYGSETLGCMKAFPLEIDDEDEDSENDDQDDDDDAGKQEEEEEEEEEPLVDLPPPPSHRGSDRSPPLPSYPIDPVDRLEIPPYPQQQQQQQQPLPEPYQEPELQYQQPQQQPVAAYPTELPDEEPLSQQQPVAAYPMELPDEEPLPQQQPVAAYPTELPDEEPLQQQQPVAAYPTELPDDDELARRLQNLGF